MTKRLPRLLLALATLVLVVAVATTLWLLRDPTPRFLERRSALIGSVPIGLPDSTAGHFSTTVRLTATSGLAVDLMVRAPAGPAPESGRPLFLILGGYRTGEMAASLIEDTRGSVVAAMGYPYDGPFDIQGFEIVRYIPRIRRALLDTPPAVMLALDHLLARGDVDPARVELVGASFGSFFTGIAAALDPRVSRLWMVHGAGHPYRLFEHSLARYVPWALPRAAVAGLFNVLSAGPRLAPERWVPRVAPRPVIMVNAQDDERLPRDAVEALHASAGEPSEVIWLEGQHVQPDRVEIVRALVDLVLTRAMADPP